MTTGVLKVTCIFLLHKAVCFHEPVKVVLRLVLYTRSILPWVMFSRSNMLNLCHLCDGTCFEDTMISDNSVLCRCRFLCLNGRSSAVCLNFLSCNFAIRAAYRNRSCIFTGNYSGTRLLVFLKSCLLGKKKEYYFVIQTLRKC